MLYHQHTNYRTRTRNSNDFVSHDPDSYTMNHTLLHTSQPSSVLYIVGSIHLADECILATYTPYFFFHASTALCNERTLTASYFQNNTALTIFYHSSIHIQSLSPHELNRPRSLFFQHLSIIVGLLFHSLFDVPLSFLFPPQL